MTEPDLRAAITHVHRELGRLGLNEGNAGNVSARWVDGMVITPTGATPESVTEAGLVRMGFDQAAPRASSEWHMHAAIYQGAPGAGAIVHTHADACTALACLAEGLPAFHYMVASFGGDDVRCAPYVTFGTPELAVAAAVAIEGRTACLLANHGMIVHGRDLADALATSLRLERLCRVYLLARAAGRVRLLTTAEMAAARARFRTYGKA